MTAARNFQGLANGGARQQLLLSYISYSNRNYCSETDYKNYFS